LLSFQQLHAERGMTSQVTSSPDIKPGKQSTSCRRIVGQYYLFALPRIIFYTIQTHIRPQYIKPAIKLTPKTAGKALSRGLPPAMQKPAHTS
ncbi:unnamed protein product, partial [Penicillium nalgiovense]